jgi:hypothetical protein
MKSIEKVVVLKKKQKYLYKQSIKSFLRAKA